MSEKITWVVLTDGYFIKVMYFTGDEIHLSTYREGDFEHSSDITYKLITRYRQTSGNAQDGSVNPLYGLLTDLLTEHLKKGDFSELILLAPEQELKKLKETLPDVLTNHIGTSITGDYLAQPQDQLETLLRDKLRNKS